MKNINLLEIIPNNNKYTHDFDNIYNKSIDFINHSNVITDDVTWFYDTGDGEHETNDKSLLVNFKYESIKLCCANGLICQFEGYGTYECFINKQYIKLEKVLLSKHVHKNLISIELAKSGFISLINSSDGEKARLKLWDKNKTNLGTFLSSKYDQFPIKTQNFNSNKIIGNDIMHIGKLDDKSIEI